MLRASCKRDDVPLTTEIAKYGCNAACYGQQVATQSHQAATQSNALQRNRTRCNAIGRVAAQHAQVSLGDIPLMVKSTKCSLRGLTPKELIAKGEEAQVQRRTDECIGRIIRAKKT